MVLWYCGIEQKDRKTPEEWEMDADGIDGIGGFEGGGGGDVRVVGCGLHVSRLQLASNSFQASKVSVGSRIPAPRIVVSVAGVLGAPQWPMRPPTAAPTGCRSCMDQFAPLLPAFSCPGLGPPSATWHATLTTPHTTHRVQLAPSPPPDANPRTHLHRLLLGACRMPSLQPPCRRNNRPS